MARSFARENKAKALAKVAEQQAATQAKQTLASKARSVISNASGLVGQAFDVVKAQFERHCVQLQALADVSEKEAFKKTIIAEYLEYLAGYADSGEQHQNPVLSRVIFWLIDIGDIHHAMFYARLAIAQQQGQLHRNFQGYTTQGECDLLGLGVSSISSVGKSFSQEKDTTEKSFKAYPLPVVYFTPETDWGFGAVSLFSFRLKGEPKESRNSQFQFGGAYTQRDQLLFYLPFQLYYKNEKYYAFGELGYYKYSYRFFGIGNDLPPENEELYNVNFPRVRLNMMKLVKPSWYLGVRYWFDEYDIVKIKNQGLLATQDIVGAKGGTVSSLGLISLFDSRKD